MNEEKPVTAVPDAAITVVGSTALESITRGEIDIQIATAHRFPRSMQAFKKRATEMVTLDEETAASCLYRRPVGKDKAGRPTYAEGKSIRMAEIVGACYGNLRVGAILIEQTERQVKARGMAHDLESNFAATSEVIEPTIDKNGHPFSERMRAVIAKAALAKALRDATFKVVPGALCKTLEVDARRVAIGDSKTLSRRRQDVMVWINLLGIDEKRVWKALGIAGIDELGMDQMETLTGLKTAIKDGDTTPDEAFPRTDVAMPTPKEPPTLSNVPDPTGTGNPVAHIDRDAVTAEIKDLIEKTAASQLDRALKAVGVNFQEGEAWEQLPTPKLVTLNSLLKASHGSKGK